MKVVKKNEFTSFRGDFKFVNKFYLQKVEEDIYVIVVTVKVFDRDTNKFISYSPASDAHMVCGEKEALVDYNSCVSIMKL